MPAVGAGIVVGLLAGAVGLRVAGRWHHTDWRWNAALVGAAALAAVLMVVAGMLARRRARPGGRVATTVSGPAAEPEPSTVDLPDWTSAWGGEVANRPEPAPAEPDTPVRGYVRDAAGEALADTTLTLIAMDGTQAGRSRTGADGWYQIAVPAPGTFTLIARARGHQPKASVVATSGDPVELDLTLTGTARLTGTVRVAGTERGVAGATLALVSASGEVCAVGQTTDSGRYGFDELAGGGYTLVVHATGFHPTAVPVTLPDSSFCDVTLSGAASVSGTARAADHRPLPDTLVTLLDSAGNPAAELCTGPDGRYQFDSLIAGDYTIVATGYPAISVRLHLADGGEHAQDLTLSHHPG